MHSEFFPVKLPSTAQRLNAMFQAFDGLLLVLDMKGTILDYKAGGNSALESTIRKKGPHTFQHIASADAWKKYKDALRQLRAGSRVVLFEYKHALPRENIWCEARLVPFANGQNIMFIRDITKHKQSSWDELTLIYDKTIESWSQALHLRDLETEDHTRRVAELALKLSRQLTLPEADLIHIQRGAVLHDIGKVAIPDHILFKPGPLTEEEWMIMRRHTVIASEILTPILYLAPALPIPRSHHEKWDGSGYPDGLAGEAIPLFARIFAFADVFDALTSDRPYRRAWPRAEAVAYIKEQSGRQFDPFLVPVFLGMVAYS